MKSAVYQSTALTAMLVSLVSATEIDATNNTTTRHPCLSFSELDMRLERNVTDGDAEVVIFAKGQDEGLENLLILAPDRQRVIADILGNRRGVGLREFVLESAEPPELSRVLRSFPEGEYFFYGLTQSGRCLRGTSALSHVLAPETTLLSPVQDEIVPINALVLRWTAVAGAEKYIVELNNEDTGAEYLFDVLAPNTQLSIPSNFLESGNEYQFVVGAKASDGNISFVENTFLVE